MYTYAHKYILVHTHTHTYTQNEVLCSYEEQSYIILQENGQNQVKTSQTHKG